MREARRRRLADALREPATDPRRDREVRARVRELSRCANVQARTGRSSAWLERRRWVARFAGSNRPPRLTFAETGFLSPTGRASDLGPITASDRRPVRRSSTRGDARDTRWRGHDEPPPSSSPQRRAAAACARPHRLPRRARRHRDSAGAGIRPAAATATACAAGDSTPAVGAAQLERTVLCLVNRERTRRGLARLRAERRLDRAARNHSRDMVRRELLQPRLAGRRLAAGPRQARRLPRRRRG